MRLFRAPLCHPCPLTWCKGGRTGVRISAIMGKKINDAFLCLSCPETALDQVAEDNAEVVEVCTAVVKLDCFSVIGPLD